MPGRAGTFLVPPASGPGWSPIRHPVISEIRGDTFMIHANVQRRNLHVEFINRYYGYDFNGIFITLYIVKMN